MEPTARRVILKNANNEYIVPEVAKATSIEEGNLDPPTSDAVHKALANLDNSDIYSQLTQIKAELQTKAPVTLDGNHVVRTIWGWPPNANGNISPPQYANQTISTHSGGEDLTIEFPAGARWAVVAVTVGSGSNYYEVTLDGTIMVKSGNGGYPTEHRCIVPGNEKQVLTVHVSGGGTKTSYVAFKK